MEKIACEKWGGSLEVAVAAKYYQAENDICSYCVNKFTCKREKDLADDLFMGVEDEKARQNDKEETN